MSATASHHPFSPGRGVFAARNPRVEMFVSEVVQRVEEGKLRDGDRLPSIREIAKSHDMTFAVARAAVQQLERVGLAERLHGSGTYVRQRRPRTSFAATQAAPTASLATGGVYLFLESRAHLLGDLAHDLTGQLQRAGTVPRMASWRIDDAEQVRMLLQRMEQTPPRAAVLQGLVPERDTVLQAHSARGTRVITIGYIPRLVVTGWHSVSPDFSNAYRLAAEHALKLGHRRIGLVLKQRLVNRWVHSQRKSLMVHSQQILGAGHALREHGLHNAMTIHYNRPIGLDPSGIPIDPANVARMAKWLSEPNRPTAIIGDDFRMLGVRLAAIQAGLKIPDDLLLIGVGGTFLAHAGEMPTVSLRYDLIAEQVGRLLLADESEFGGAAQHIVVPPMLHERSINLAPLV